MNFSNLIRLLGLFFEQLGKALRLLANVFESFSTRLYATGNPSKIRRGTNHGIGKGGSVTRLGVAPNAAIRKSPEIPDKVLEGHATEMQDKASEAKPTMPEQHAHEVQHKEVVARHEISERHAIPKEKHEPEIRHEAAAAKHEVPELREVFKVIHKAPERNEHEVRREESEAEHEVLEQHKIADAGHKPEAKHTASVRKQQDFVFQLEGTGHATASLPPINARLYSIMTSSIPDTNQARAALKTETFAHTYATHSDSAHDIAKILVDNLNSPKSAATKITTVRNPNMNHSLAAMFFGMPTAPTRLKEG